MNGTETDLLRQILIAVQALSTGGGIADGSVTTPKIADLNVTEPKLAVNSVTTAKILDANVTPAKLSQPFSIGSPANTTSGVLLDFTGIPSWVKFVLIPISGLSTNGSNSILLQLGTSGGIQTSGYTGASAAFVGTIAEVANFSSAAFAIHNISSAGSIYNGVIALTLVDSSTNTWIFSQSFGRSDAAIAHVGSGVVSLSAPLSRFRFTTFGATDTFDAGKINALWQ
jgi:hypothetical protein